MYHFSLKQDEANMEEWHKKELTFQGIQEFSSYIKNEIQIDNKSILDDFTSHITIAGTTFFNKYWLTAVLFFRLLERERQSKDKNYTHILPHPLFLLFHNEPETDIYILATKQSLIVPQDEYACLYDNFMDTGGSYKLPKYSHARSYLTILLELIRLFIIHIPTSPKTKLFTYDKINACVSLHVRCLRDGKCSYYKELLCMNLKLENQLSNIVGNCPYNKFKERPKNFTMEDFMRSTLFNQTTNTPDNGKYDEPKQVVDNESQPSKDKPHVITEKSLLEDEETTGNNTD